MAADRKRRPTNHVYEKTLYDIIIKTPFIIEDKMEKDPRVKETSPDGKSANQSGVKLDAGKIPVFRGLIDYFPNACMAVAEVSQKGAEKYTWKGWIDVPDGQLRYTDAVGRHLIKECLEGEIDPDFGLLHAAHLAWNAMARLELKLMEKKNAQTLSSTM